MGTDRRRGRRNEGEARRRAELLQGHPGLGTARVGREQAGNPLDQRERLLWRPLPQRLAVALEEKGQRRLASVIGELPVPPALGVRTAKGIGHDGAQRGAIDGSAGFKAHQQRLRGI